MSVIVTLMSAGTPDGPLLNVPIEKRTVTAVCPLNANEGDCRNPIKSSRTKHLGRSGVFNQNFPNSFLISFIYYQAPHLFLADACILLTPAFAWFYRLPQRHARTQPTRRKMARKRPPATQRRSGITNLPETGVSTTSSAATL